MINHASVFQPLLGLPPTREADHEIKLFPSIALINVRPYRYPQFQKDEIEKLVEAWIGGGLLIEAIGGYSNTPCVPCALVMQSYW